MPAGGFIHSDEGMSWELYAVAANAIAKSGYSGKVDLDDTLMVQLTTPEVGMFTLGCLLVSRIFPELYPLALVLNAKLIELVDVQEFFTPPSSDEGSTVDGE